MQEFTSYRISDDELHSLAAVHSNGLLDTLPEPDFDALTHLSSSALNTSAAIFGLLDEDRIWIKSQVGIRATQIDPRFASYPATPERPDGLIVVPDLQHDASWSETMLLQAAPQLRFYAGAPLFNASGSTVGVLAVIDTKPRILEARERKLLEELATLAMAILENRRLARLARSDYLTALDNRAEFQHALASEIAHAKRTHALLTLGYMDLDAFKDVNDRFGHAAGDEVLREVAERLRGQTRTEDKLARIGGDEFCVIMRDATPRTIRTFKQRITQALSRPISLKNGSQVRIGMSIGMATYKVGFDTAMTLMARADAHLYKAKRRGEGIRWRRMAWNGSPGRPHLVPAKLSAWMKD